MQLIRITLAIVLLCLNSCTTPPDPAKEIPEFLLKFPQNSFAYPVGEEDYVTEKNDWWDAWYNAQDFGENRHLGEDWNKTTGGDTDCDDMSRRFDFCLTYDRDLAVEAARALLARIAPA